MLLHGFQPSLLRGFCSFYVKQRREGSISKGLWLELGSSMLIELRCSSHVKRALDSFWPALELAQPGRLVMRSFEVLGNGVRFYAQQMSSRLLHFSVTYMGEPRFGNAFATISDSG
ncbi:hypothetical protein VNO77_43936 [Canavalia gladiata]|uniref:Uncharacterized protein n=1 Tax=Canavalia gladiata TaxID=3824 RepID=A0AAN9JY13_CANGL